jgi:hypothetical protein
MVAVSALAETDAAVHTVNFPGSLAAVRVTSTNPSAALLVSSLEVWSSDGDDVARGGLATQSGSGNASRAPAAPAGCSASCGPASAAIDGEICSYAFARAEDGTSGGAWVEVKLTASLPGGVGGSVLVQLERATSAMREVLVAGFDTAGAELFSVAALSDADSATRVHFSAHDETTRLLSSNETACDAGFWFNDTTCAPCATGATACNSTAIATECAAGFDLIDGACVCPTGYRHVGDECLECRGCVVEDGVLKSCVFCDEREYRDL